MGTGRGLTIIIVAVGAFAVSGCGRNAPPPSTRPAPLVALPPMRRLGAIAATSHEEMTNVQSVRGLGDGRVLVHDRGLRRVLLLDSALATARIILDTTRATGAGYSSTLMSLVPMHRDSTMLVDLGPVPRIRVIDPAGRIVRTVALARNAPGNLVGALVEGASVDGAGRLVYTSAIMTPRVPPNLARDTVIWGPDSMPVLRFDPRTMQMDTAAMLQAPLAPRAYSMSPLFGLHVMSLINPIERGQDDWAELSDGTLAIIRIGDYHIDWFHPDGRKTSTPPVAHNWQHVTDSMKKALMDSVRRSPRAVRADAQFRADSAAFDSVSFLAAYDPKSVLGPDGKPRRPVAPVRQRFMAPGDLPDVRPPFVSAGTFVDPDGNIWVRAYAALTPTRGQGYEVIDRQGVLIDRVRIPAGTTLMGFCPGFAILRRTMGSTAVISKIPIH